MIKVTFYFVFDNEFYQIQGYDSDISRTKKQFNMNNLFELSPEEKKKILEKHKDATKNHYVKKEETKKGLQKPGDKKEKTS